MNQIERSSDHNLTIEKEQLKEGTSQTLSEVAQMEKLLAGTDQGAAMSGSKVKSRILLTISVQPTAKIRAEIAAGQQPRRDYDALQQALGADVIYPDDTQTTLLGPLLRRLFGARTAVAWAAFCRHREYDYIFSDTEGVGLPLAMLMKFFGTRPGHPRHTLIAQYLSPFKKRIFFQLGVGSHLDTISVHSSAQYALATDVLHMPSERVIKLPMFADVQFWRPSTSGTTDGHISTVTELRPMIFSAGSERRDYLTLFAAVRDLDVDVYIAAASAAAFHRNAADRRVRAPARLSDIPKNVFVKSCNYAGMRNFYDAARFVVVPVVETNDSAGLTVILEAMAMAKAVIVSGTRGQTDVIRDPRNNGRGPIVREWWPGFLDNPDVAETLGRLPTGFYVTPGNPNELRSMIQYLLDHPEVAEELGRNGRRVVEEYFDLDAFTQRFAATILDEPLPTDVAAHRKTS